MTVERYYYLVSHKNIVHVFDQGWTGVGQRGREKLEGWSENDAVAGPPAAEGGGELQAWRSAGGFATVWFYAWVSCSCSPAAGLCCRCVSAVVYKLWSIRLGCVFVCVCVWSHRYSISIYGGMYVVLSFSLCVYICIIDSTASGMMLACSSTSSISQTKFSGTYNCHNHSSAAQCTRCTPIGEMRQDKDNLYVMFISAPHHISSVKTSCSCHVSFHIIAPLDVVVITAVS